MAHKYIWRFFQIVTPIVALMFFWKLIPSPTLVHTSEYWEAKAKAEAWQLAPDDQAGIEALCVSANALVGEAVGVLPTIEDPTARLTKLQKYRDELQIILSHHPLFPGLVFDRTYYTQMSDAAGLCGGVDSEFEIIQAVQNHPEILKDTVSRELMEAHGIGFTESSRITVPYYTLLISRFLLILFLASWAGTLVTAAKMYEFGYNPIAVAQRDLGSWQSILFIAPIANLFIMEHYDDPSVPYHSDGVLGSYLGDQHEKLEIQHTSRILTGVSSLPKAIILMLEPIWKGMTWKDPVKLSFKFRYAVVASLAIIINVMVVTGARAGTIEEYTYVGGDGAVSWSTRFLLPDPGGGTWQIDWDLLTDYDSITAGYRWPWQDLGSGVSLQPRLLSVSNDGDITAAKVQGLFIGNAGNHSWYFFTSWKIPDGRASVYNELGFDLNPGQTPTFRLVAIEFNGLGQSANWRIGPEIQFAIGNSTIKVHQGLGIGGLPSEFRASVCFPF
ncbi:hypothetical protein ACFL14_01090 [Patescibacteria group bacterium]